LKSVSSLFSRKPRTITRLPLFASMVVVIDSAFPSPVHDRDVRGADGLVVGIVGIRGLDPGGTPARARPSISPGG
jgi:hypothetical protein